MKGYAWHDWRERKKANQIKRTKRIEEIEKEKEKKRNDQLTMTGFIMKDFGKTLDYVRSVYPWEDKDITIENGSNGIKWSITVFYRYSE